MERLVPSCLLGNGVVSTVAIRCSLVGCSIQGMDNTGEGIQKWQHEWKQTKDINMNCMSHKVLLSISTSWCLEEGREQSVCSVHPITSNGKSRNAEWVWLYGLVYTRLNQCTPDYDPRQDFEYFKGCKYWTSTTAAQLLLLIRSRTSVASRSMNCAANSPGLSFRSFTKGVTSIQ